MKLYDLITFAIMAHLRSDGVYKKAYRVLIEELHLFPKVKYNKILERLSRYENLLAWNYLNWIIFKLLIQSQFRLKNSLFCKTPKSC
jgi:hypothetical protein